MNIAIASLLALLALVTLVIKSFVEWQFERDMRTAAALPPLDPPGTRLVSCGLRVGP